MDPSSLHGRELAQPRPVGENRFCRFCNRVLCTERGDDRVHPLQLLSFWKSTQQNHQNFPCLENYLITRIFSGTALRDSWRPWQVSGIHEANLFEWLQRHSSFYLRRWRLVFLKFTYWKFVVKMICGGSSFWGRAANAIQIFVVRYFFSEALRSLWSVAERKRCFMSYRCSSGSHSHRWICFSE